MMLRILSLGVLLAFLTTCSSGQSSLESGALLGEGLSVRGGLGRLAIRDDYISQEVYVGTLPYFEAVWLRSRDSSAYRIALEYRASESVKNNNVSAGITQASLNLDYLYYTGRFWLFGKDVLTYVGPSTEMYFYYRQQNIANGGLAIFNAYSFAGFFSLGANSVLVLPLQSNLFVEGSGRLGLLSFGGRLADMYNKNEKMIKLTSILSGIRGYTELLIRYNLADALTLKGGYRFEIFQSSSWDYLLSASDNLVLAVAYRL